MGDRRLLGATWLFEAQASDYARWLGLACRGLRKSNRRPDKYPWMTVRDALADVPEPTSGGNFFHNHRLQPGARTYVGHTGSPLDLPAKTLKAGDHGVPRWRKHDGPRRWHPLFHRASRLAFRRSRMASSCMALGLRPCGSWAMRCRWRLHSLSLRVWPKTG